MKIIMTKGLIGCGKTTWSKEQQKKDKNIVRVNKDELRAMMHDSYHNKANEKQIIQIEMAIIEQALYNKRTVIVDNTHGHPSHQERFEKLAKEYNTTLEIQEFDVPLATCIERDSKREKPIGKAAIMKMYNQFFKKEAKPLNSVIFNPGLPWGFCVDIDGTLATMKDRGPFEWNKVENDLPNLSVIAVVNDLYNMGRQIIIFSGRDSSCRTETEEWLRNHGVLYHELYMRPEGSMEKDSIVKKKLFEEHIKDKMNVVGVIDDRKQVKRMWVELGLTVFDVNQYDEEF